MNAEPHIRLGAGGPPGRAAFSLMELMIAVGLGLMVILIATSGYRAAAQSLVAVKRLTIENQLIGDGLHAAFRELDGWSYYDDRATAGALGATVGSSRNALRQTATVTGMAQPLLWVNQGNGQTNPDRQPGNNVAPMPWVGTNAVTWTNYAFGLPFSPLRSTWGPSAPYNQNFGGPVANNPQCGWLSEADYEDLAWAISATNTLTWWTGRCTSNLGFMGTARNSNSVTGGYGTFPGVVRHGYGSIAGVSGSPNALTGDVRPQIGYTLNVIKTRDTAPPAPPYCGSAPANPIAFKVSTTPYADVAGGYYGQCPGWLFNQLRGLQMSLGFYGMLDYMPAGVFPAYMIAEKPMAPAPATSSPMAMDMIDWDGFPLQLTYGFNAPSNGASYMLGNAKYFNFRAMQNREADGNISIPTVNQLLYPGGFSLVPWCNEWDQLGLWKAINGGTANPLVSLGGTAVKDLVFYHRSFFSFGDSTAFFNSNIGGKDYLVPLKYEPQPDGSIRCYQLASTNWTGPANTFHMGQVEDQVMPRFLLRTTGTMRLSAFRPLDWPEVTVSVAHHLRNNRQINLGRIGWSDPQSGRSFDIRFTAMGTTLRGARRQRNLDQ